MEGLNLDDMFDNMLGELDLISQQLEEDSNKNTQNELKKDPLPPPVIENKYDDNKPNLTITSAEDMDLSAMLDDLSNIEHTLTSGAGQLSSKQSASQDSGIGFNGNSLPRNLSPHRSMEDMPQFNTLKRSDNIHSSLSYETGSLEDLDRDIEAEKRQKKHQQLTQAELDSLSPDLNELDDLVNELSNMKFEYKEEIKRPQLQSSISENLHENDQTPHVNGVTPPPIQSQISMPPPTLAPKPKPPAVPQKPVVEPTPPLNATTLRPPPALPKKPGSIKKSHSKISDMLTKQFESNKNENAQPQQQQRNNPTLTPHNAANAALARQLSGSRTSVKSITSQSSNISRNSVQSNSSVVSTSSDSVSPPAEQPINQRFSFVPTEVLQQLELVKQQADKENLSYEEREERLKAEKMRLALEKLKEARITKLVVKVYNKDESSKTLMVDERMSARVVINQLLEKNHSDVSANWALIEELPSLFMERMFEEHEAVTEMLCFWTRDSTNRVRFIERKDKYALFRNPQHYLLTHSETEGQMAERQKQTLIDEFFSGKGTGSGVPEVEGTLFVKGDSKSWSQKFCVLRQSGLYYSKGGEPKKGKRATNLACLIMFEPVCIYLGRGWRKKYKSPTDYGFALKHPAIQAKSKHIKYFCCPDVRSLMRWIVGIRIAKYGKQLKDNYDKTLEEVRQLTSSTAGFFRAAQTGGADTVSIKSSDSDNVSMSGTMPLAGGVKNVFEGAWKRAQMQEESAEVEVSRQKSVYNAPKVQSGNNWWDLQEEKSPASTTSPSHRYSSTSTNSHGASMPQPSPQNLKTVPPPPPKKPNYSKSPVNSYSDMPPPPMNDMPPPPMNDMPPPPPMNDMPPPPPINDMPPPPPMMSNMSLPPPDDMPPPPMDDLPPPPPANSKPPLPAFLRNTQGGPMPVRLPALPLKPKPGSSPNRNFNNNIRPPPLPHRDSYEEKPPNFHPPTPSKEQAPSLPGQASYNSSSVPPMASYYHTSNATSYKVSDFPPPPDFVLDLKGRFNTMQSNLHNNAIYDLPPPPADLLLTQIKSKPVQRQSSKSAPPPPRRKPTTRLSSKR